MTSNDIVTSKISTRSKVALATLISVSVLGSVYYNKYYHKKDKKDKLDSKDKLIDDNSLYNDFVASLPEATMLIDNTPDNLLNKLFTSSFYTEYMPSTFEELKTKMSSLYPAFEHQLEVIRDMYKSFWEFLSLEEFKAIVQESLKEDDDPELHPEIEWEAHVREGQELSREETEFVKRRKQKMRAAFAFFIGVDEHEVEIEDIPNIGIASSGGGYRAMVSCSGYLRAMAETGILDSVLYFCGVSGSTWTMCQLYSPLTDASLDTLQDHLSSRIHTHIANLSNFLTVLNASRHNAKVILHGIIQRYHQQNNSISLVDIFGMLLGGTLLAKKITLAPPNEDKSTNDTYSEFIETDTQEEDGENHVHSGTMHEPDGARVKPRLLKKNEIKLSKQREYFEDGSLPMPIYCAVRHEIQKAGENKANTISSKTEEETEENKEDSQEHQEPKEEGEEGEVEEKEDLYQWFEFTPYDMGSEEINAWIPIWAFGRKFAEGKSDQRLPEQSIGILMGMFGSAFVASLAHFYQEIRSLLPQTAVEKADEIIYKYQSSVSTIHPISPACFPNPFYKMSTKVQDKDELNDKEEILRSESLVESEQIGLMDAGMDNNIPFYPLLRKGRDIDMIIAVDSSADIQYMPYFDRAEGYVKRRGIQGWPRGAGWPKKEEEKNN
ncbi:acyl transferase/acyl hydrolase/lysophospholipase, partial [Gilbertella persicaria]|uniref:acyl transferase/acyl hydrolase/lysophospholipase n=1 Tax=Gilbertella persicaria TaxID=101096 RepID=UPI00221EC5DD